MKKEVSCCLTVRLSVSPFAWGLLDLTVLRFNKRSSLPLTPRGCLNLCVLTNAYIFIL